MKNVFTRLKRKHLIIVFSFLFTIICLLIYFNNFLVEASSNNLNVNICGFDSDAEGDCTIITCGDIEILIDCPSGDDVFKELKEKLNNNEDIKNDTEKKFDYVIFSHGDSDHIGGASNFLTSLTEGKLINNEKWTIGTIIDFDFENCSDTEFLNKFQSTDTLNKYRETRNKIIKNTECNCSYFSATSLSSSELTKDYAIEDGNVTLKILYNYFDNYMIMNSLFNSTNGSFYRNVVSLCTLIEIKNSNTKLLFTGDLEEVDSANSYVSPVNTVSLNNDCRSKVASFNKLIGSEDNRVGGEKTLLAYHSDLLKNVTLYKAAHHGSKTSNSSDLISWIKPQYVAVTKGPNNSGSFPNSECVSRFMQYTDYIYPTKVYFSDDGAQKLYGDLKFSFNTSSSSTEVNINTEQNNTIPALCIAPQLWDATYTVTIDDTKTEKKYLESLYENKKSFSMQIIEMGSDSNSYGNCTLLKLGHYDILIDCGSWNDSSLEYISKIKNYCVDNTLEYVIITKSERSSYSQMVGTKDNGVFDTFTINNLIDFNNFTTLDSKTLSGIDKQYITKRDDLVKKSKINYLTDYGKTIEVIDDCLSLEVYKPLTKSFESNYANSISTIITFNALNEIKSSSFVFVGCSQDYSNIIDKVKKLNVLYFRAPSCMNLVDSKSFITQLAQIKPNTIGIGSTLNNYNTNGELFGNKAYLSSLLNNNIGYKNIYAIGAKGASNNPGTFICKISYTYDENCTFDIQTEYNGSSNWVANYYNNFTK